MKTINVKLYAILYKLNKTITAKMDNMKQDIINNATMTYEDCATIKVVDCTRKSYSKEHQILLDEYAKKQGFEKVETHYKRIDIDNINSKVDTIVDNIINQLENSNDKVIAKVASKVASKK